MSSLPLRNLLCTGLENENVFLDLILFFTISPQESCHCVLKSEIIGGWVQYEGEVVEDLFVKLSGILMSRISFIFHCRLESFQQFLREN